MDDEQNESDEDDVESGEECFEGNVVAVALMENPVCNATVLLVKLGPVSIAVIPTIMGISDFYATQYVTTIDNQKII